MIIPIKIKLLIYLILPIIFPNFIYSQKHVSYKDVAVIVNRNDSVSVAIGKYFKSKRNIPERNIIYVNVPSKEEIGDSEFNSLRKQIEEYMHKKRLVKKINYIVTTKGCPLKIQRDSADPLNCNASVESELTLLNGKYSKDIGNCSTKDNVFAGMVGNPYLLQTTNFSHKKFEIYLVTRLDAYTKEEVFRLIDHSGPNTHVNKDSVLFVFDGAPNWKAEGINDFSNIAELLTKRGWKVLYNSDTVYVTHQKNVIGYQSWGSNDGHTKYYTDSTAQPYNSWSNGSIAETAVSSSGRSFKPKTHYGQSLIADWIKEGATGAKCYVYEPFSEAIAKPFILFDRYSDLDKKGRPKFNLAESFYAASRFIGWKDVVIGDPKTSITTRRKAR